MPAILCPQKTAFIKKTSLLSINAVVFYYEAKIIFEMREKLLTLGGVYILRDEF